MSVTFFKSKTMEFLVFIKKMSIENATINSFQFSKSNYNFTHLNIVAECFKKHNPFLLSKFGTFSVNRSTSS